MISSYLIKIARIGEASTCRRLGMAPLEISERPFGMSIQCSAPMVVAVFAKRIHLHRAEPIDGLDLGRAPLPSTACRRPT